MQKKQFSDKGSQRVDPEMVNACHPDHMQRYEFAQRFTQGKTVLDVGCAFGYGTDFLAKNRPARYRHRPLC